MRMYLIFILFTTILITGCSTVGSKYQNQTATKIVAQVNPSHIERQSIKTLTLSFHNSSSSPFSGAIVEITGEVVAFALSENNLYTVTISDDGDEAVCVFDDSISGKLGDGREIYSDATITVRGQCAASGLFSSTAFSLNGCRLVSN